MGSLQECGDMIDADRHAAAARKYATLWSIGEFRTEVLLCSLVVHCKSVQYEQLARRLVEAWPVAAAASVHICYMQYTYPQVYFPTTNVNVFIAIAVLVVHLRVCTWEVRLGPNSRLGEAEMTHLPASHRPKLGKMGWD